MDFHFLRSEIVLIFAKVCYKFEQKNFLPPGFYEKSCSKCTKNEPVCICKISWCVGLRQQRSCLDKGGGNCMKYLVRGRIEQRGGETKHLK